MKYVLLTGILLATLVASGVAQTGLPSDDFNHLKKVPQTSTSTDKAVKIKDFVVKGEEMTSDGRAYVAISCKFEITEAESKRLYGKIFLKLLDKDGKLVKKLQCPGLKDKPAGWAEFKSSFATSITPEEWAKVKKQELEFAGEEPPK